jgi:CheY-like chemotaxis protein
MRSAKLRGRRALVVDDDTVSRLVLAHMLRRSGWDVQEADDLGPATVLAATEHFDLIFCDYWLPAGNGLELHSVLAKDGSRAPFILVTGTLEHTDLQREYGNEVAAYLTKPVSTRSLRECLAAIEMRTGGGAPPAH